MRDDFTTCLVLDRHCLGQLTGVWPTWRRFKPELFTRPLLVICDSQDGDSNWWRHKLQFLDDHPHRQLAYWGWPDSDDSELGGMSQRERMLTAWVKIPPHIVETPYWLKIDSDVVATRRGPWFDPDWFAQQPALIASPWGYTKPATWPGDLDRWARTVSRLALLPALDLPEPGPEQRTIRHKRIASWICWVDTIFSKTAATYSPGRLPVPSQDTYHWYVAQRMGEKIIKTKMSKLGWQTISSDRRRAKLIAEVLAADGPITDERCCQ